jgi:hypothetical protein
VIVSFDSIAGSYCKAIKFWVAAKSQKKSLILKKSQMENPEYRFNDIVEIIFSLPLEDKLKLRNLLEQHIAGQRRKEMASNFKSSLKEYKSGKLRFSDNTDDLKI